ncbi:MAG: hypothetical protein V1899_00490 [Planctomycetota bacterium]
MKHWLLLTVLASACFRLAAEDVKLAEGFAVGGVDLIAKNKIDKGQQLLFKALAYDNNCALALYELGKQFEEECNLVSAADFLARAVVELAKGEKNRKDYVAKRADATRRLQKLNPYAIQISLLLENYAQDLIKINQKNSDGLTAEEISNRLDLLNLTSVLPKDKIPIASGKLVLWNQYNADGNNWGTLQCNISLFQGSKIIWEKKELPVKWESGKDCATELRLPPIAFDRIRVEITKWYSMGGGLAEIEIWKGATNIARGCLVMASSVYRERSTIQSVTDGITTSAHYGKGYWRLSKGAAGWVEVDFTKKSPVNTTPSADGGSE